MLQFPEAVHELLFLPEGLSLDSCITFSDPERCSAPAMRKQGPQLLGLWLSVHLALSALAPLSPQ